jgi:hypothetical protein
LCLNCGSLKTQLARVQSKALFQRARIVSLYSISQLKEDRSPPVSNKARDEQIQPATALIPSSPAQMQLCERSLSIMCSLLRRLESARSAVLNSQATENTNPYGSLGVCVHDEDESILCMCWKVCAQTPMYAFAVNIAIQGERERSLCTDRGARDERNKRDDGVALSLLFAPRVCTFALSLGDAVVYYDFQKAGRGSTGQTRRRRIKQQSVTPR